MCYCWLDALCVYVMTDFFDQAHQMMDVEETCVGGVDCQYQLASLSGGFDLDDERCLFYLFELLKGGESDEDDVELSAL